ncbi:DUF4007 family protein [Serratia plymuthica]|uniref:DUF4007 family protein n=1 Tax=Serratia plymuthica TaxID=82996 RepID=UPI00093D98E1|nr:DUF4007 family protein [Serratia plymuthica]
MANLDGTELHFSGHETFPLRQMWLKKVCDQADSEGWIAKSVFTDEDAITRFGVGKNMVSSIRHWALATRTIKDIPGKSCFQLTDLGANIFSENGWDQYSENIATTWLMHWQLVGKNAAINDSKHRSASWYLLFNTYTAQDFNNEDVSQHIKKYLSDHKYKSVSDNTLKRDVETCIKGYVPSQSSRNIEDIAEPMLAELSLIKISESGKLCFQRGPKTSLSDEIFDYCLMMYWQAVSEMESSLSLNDITYSPGAPGRVFKLDEDSVAERLVNISERTNGALQWISSSGIHQIMKDVNLHGNSLSKLAFTRLRSAYK